METVTRSRANDCLLLVVVTTTFIISSGTTFPKLMAANGCKWLQTIQTCEFSISPPARPFAISSQPLIRTHNAVRDKYRNKFTLTELELLQLVFKHLLAALLSIVVFFRSCILASLSPAFAPVINLSLLVVGIISLQYPPQLRPVSSLKSF